MGKFRVSSDEDGVRSDRPSDFLRKKRARLFTRKKINRSDAIVDKSEFPFGDESLRRAVVGGIYQYYFILEKRREPAKEKYERLLPDRPIFFEPPAVDCENS